MFSRLFSVIDNCSPNQRHTSKVCNNEVNGFTCACLAGFTGNTCDQGSVFDFSFCKKKL